MGYVDQAGGIVTELQVVDGHRCVLVDFLEAGQRSIVLGTGFLRAQPEA